MVKNLLVLFSLSLFLTAWSSPLVKVASRADGLVAFPESGNSCLRLVNTEDGVRKADESHDAEGEWIPVGEGEYRDILFSDLFGKSVSTFKVAVEQNASDPTVYRIPNLYENMDFSEYGGYLTYDASKAEPMVIHVYRDTYAYFDEFDTGVYSTYYSGYNNYSGEIYMLMQGADLLKNNDIETLAYYLPECLLQMIDGNFVMEPTFYLENHNFYNILGLCYVTGTTNDALFPANTHGDFQITLPGHDIYDPDDDWEDIGTASYTDVFTEWMYESNPVYNTWDVTVQRNIYEPYRYRLLNPYKNFQFPGVTFDSSRSHDLELYIQDYDGFSLVGIPTFNTGLDFTGLGMLSISNQAADVVKSTYGAYLELYYTYMGCLGLMEDGVISYTADCAIDYELYKNFYGYFGEFDWDGDFVGANTKGNFRIEMPASLSGIHTIDSCRGNEERYYSLQGIRVMNPAPGQLLIRKRGGKSEKVLY